MLLDKIFNRRPKEKLAMVEPPKIFVKSYTRAGNLYEIYTVGDKMVKYKNGKPENQTKK